MSKIQFQNKNTQSSNHEKAGLKNILFVASKKHAFLTSGKTKALNFQIMKKI